MEWGTGGGGARRQGSNPSASSTSAHSVPQPEKPGVWVTPAVVRRVTQGDLCRERRPDCSRGGVTEPQALCRPASCLHPIAWALLDLALILSFFTFFFSFLFPLVPSLLPRRSFHTYYTPVTRQAYISPTVTGPGLRPQDRAQHRSPWAHLWPWRPEWCRVGAHRGMWLLPSRQLCPGTSV